MRNWWLTTVTMLSLVTLASGCPKGNDTTDTDTNVDTDTDTDTDTNVDTDTNTDTFDTGGYYGPAARCPDWDFNTGADGAGTYTVVVEMPFGCVSDTSTTGAYTINVSGGTGLAPAANGGDITSDAAAAMIGIPVTTTHSVGTAAVTVVPGTPPTYTALAGTGRFTRATDGATPVCDVSFALTSTAAYTGDCTDCTFGFKVDSTVTNDANTPDCVKDFAYDALTFQSGDVPDSANYTGPSVSDNWIGFSPEYTYSGFFGDKTYTDSLVSGLTYTGYSTNYYSPNYHTNATVPVALHLATELNGDPDYGTTTFDSTTGALGFDIQFDTMGCDGGLGGEGTVGASGAGHDDTLMCDGSVVDVFTFTVAANTDVKVSVDSATGEDTVLTVYNSTGCTVGSSDDAFMCSGAQ